MEIVRDETNIHTTNLQIELLKNQISTLNQSIQLLKEEKSNQTKMIIENTNRTVSAILSFLKKLLDEETYQIVEAQLKEINTSKMVQAPLQSILSQQEYIVAGYILEGFTSKEIAEQMYLSKKAIDYYRTNIRKKLKASSNEDLLTVLKNYE